MGLVQYSLIVIVNMEYHIIVFIVRDSVFLCMNAVHGEFDCRICSSLTVCSQFWYESSTGTQYLKLVLGFESSTGNLDWKLLSSTGTHISVEKVMFLQLPNFY